MSQSGAGVVICPQCGAENQAAAPVCWLCSRRIDAPTAHVEHAAAPGSGTYSLATLMLVMTLVVVGAALFALAPGLGVLLAIFALPAFIRTNFLLKRQAALGRQPTILSRALVFTGSLFTVITVTFIAIIASVGSFCAICIAGAGSGVFSEEIAFAIALFAGLAGGLCAIAGMRAFLRFLRRSKELDRENPTNQHPPHDREKSDPVT